MAAFLQSKSGQANGNNPAVTLDATPTDGNLLVAFIAVASTVAYTVPAGWTSGVVSSGGSGGTTRRGGMFYKIASGDSATVTVTWAGSSNWVMAVAEYSGVNNDAPIVIENSQLNASGTVNTPTVTWPGETRDALVVCGISNRGGAITFSAEQVNASATGVTEREDQSANASISACIFESFPTSATGTYVGAATSSGAAVGLGAIMVFRSTSPDSIMDSYALSNADTNRALDGGGADNKGAGQSFTGDGGQITSVVFLIRKSGAPTGNATAVVYAHTGTYGTSSTPTGAALATSDTLDVTLLQTTNPYPVEFKFSSPFTTVNATNYFIDIEFSGGDASNTLIQRSDSSSPIHGGNEAHSVNLSTWTATATTDVPFIVYKPAGAAFTPTAIAQTSKLLMGVGRG